MRLLGGCHGVIYVGRMSAGANSSRGAGKPRLLVLTPDFPPAPGGIQGLMGGLTAGLDGFDVRVVTFDEPGAPGFDAGVPYAVRRVGAPARLSRTRNVALNAAVLREARSFRPRVCLSGHIVTSPATAAL